MSYSLEIMDEAALATKAKVWDTDLLIVVVLKVQLKLLPEQWLTLNPVTSTLFLRRYNNGLNNIQL